jgi:hypothetical protein
MLEKQVYCEEFFKFISDLMGAIKLPEDYTPKKDTYLPNYYRNYK